MNRPYFAKRSHRKTGPSRGTATGRVVSEPVALIDVAPTIGAVESALLVVVYTVREGGGEVIRLIPARRANVQERKAYRRHQA